MTNRVALLIAVVLAGISIFLLIQYVEREREEAYRGTKLIDVCVLTRDVTAGEQFDENMVQSFRVPEQVLDHFTDAVPYSDVSQYDGEPIATDVEAGQILRHDHISTIHTGEARIGLADGLRAVSCAIEYDAGLSGLLQVNNYVDVVGVFEIESALLGQYLGYPQDGGGSGKKVQAAVVIARRAKILALDASTSPGTGPGYQSVTLMVNPVEAELVALVNEYGKIHLLLRNDTERMPQRDDLLNGIANMGAVLPNDLMRILQAERSTQPSPLAPGP